MSDESVSMYHPDLDEYHSFFASQVPVFEESGWVVREPDDEPAPPAAVDAPEES